MPRLKKALSMGMKKGDHGRKRGVVVVDNVCQVSHRFMALVDRCGEFAKGGIGCVGGIDDVDRTLPTAIQ